METKEVLTLPTIMVDMVIMTAITTIITDTDGEDMTRVIMVDMEVMEATIMAMEVGDMIKANRQVNMVNNRKVHEEAEEEVIIHTTDEEIYRMVIHRFILIPHQSINGISSIMDMSTFLTKNVVYTTM
ncbi:uncharacterized protein [Mytilus edulis]|uniref:uncharacterized protein isoform X3 n=1 Tax=Mytilus edulis TaxID=6550 RepID=UPI0039F00B72